MKEILTWKAKEGNRRARALYAIVVEKVPHSLFSQYYRRIKERGKAESLEELREWVAEEA